MEREAILVWLRTILRENTSAAIVTRNMRKAASIKELPAIFILDFGDEIAKDNGGPYVQKIMRIALGMVVQGVTEETAPEAMSNFLQQIRLAIYGDPPTRTVGDVYKGSFYETGESELLFPEETSKLVAKRLNCNVLYAEDIRRLSE